MIIIGYQGIGKSTLCKKDNSIIDLESSNFWIPAKDNPEVKSTSSAIYRHSDWYNAYCNIAEDLSRQGHVVFVSSHLPVRERLKKSEEIVVAIAPAPTTEMETIWLNKLRDRYEASGLEKDYKALKNAEDRYKENLQEIFSDTKIYVMIHDPNYSLEDIVYVLSHTPKDMKENYVEDAAKAMSGANLRNVIEKYKKFH